MKAAESSRKALLPSLCSPTLCNVKIAFGTRVCHRNMSVTMITVVCKNCSSLKKLDNFKQGLWMFSSRKHVWCSFMLFYRVPQFWQLIQERRLDITVQCSALDAQAYCKVFKCRNRQTKHRYNSLMQSVFWEADNVSPSQFLTFHGTHMLIAVF